ncbi:hypothetical protein N7474_010226 [Penicillium riverlandense]|uniref:uncharacterized protein n=1 Tax=Penicillium riverlandense TaxID=1903569 RepID=UPI0025480065|nr:uncharacterized protein N7474_010226 [Penicillium riverlandense]KAJ5808957.1 hypothetical protein N7474_010226 [Penicillium riverlandense]
MLEWKPPFRSSVVVSDSSSPSASAAPSREPTPHTMHRPEMPPDASLVLVGIRGCGKRSLGFVAATALKRRFITADYYFQETTGITRKEYLKTHGSQKFQRRDIEVLKMMLDNNQKHCIIELGLGSLTRSVQDHLRRYCQTNPVVHLIRDINRIQQLLGLDDEAVRLLRDGDSSHRACSNYEFYNCEDRTVVVSDDGSPDRRSGDYSFKLQEVKEDFTRFVSFITGANVNHSSYDSPFVLLETPPELRSFTHAIFVRSSDLIADRVNLPELESGGDAIELCVDRWSSQMVATVSEQVSVLRRNARAPVILSIDAAALAADAHNQSPEQASRTYFDILEHGLRLGVEYLVVDLVGGKTKIIGQHIFGASARVTWEDDSCVAIYRDAEKLGCQLVRLLRVAVQREENAAVAQFTRRIGRLPGTHPPLIAYNIGPLGRTSQIFNSILTAVKHPAIVRLEEKVNQCDPQLTSADVMRALCQSYMLDPLKFYILGKDVAYSVSPAMHNAAIQYCGLSHKYSIPDSPSLAVVDRLGRDPNFGGASVVQPWRVEVYQKLASKSRHAEAIGAINTIMPLREAPDGSMFPLQEQASRRGQAGRPVGFFGENTDWVGIMTCITRHLSPRNAISAPKTTGLVIVPGEEVARHFNSWASSQVDSTEVVRVLRSTQDDWPADALPPSLIASCVPADPDRDEPPANFEMPIQWLGSPTGGVVLELSYKPLDTPLLRQMRRFRSETGRPWVLSDGLENVIEQGIAQFELMTGRKAPRRLMTREVLRNYEGEGGFRFDEKSIQARLDGVYSM